VKSSIPAALALVVLLPCARAGAADPIGALETSDCAGVVGWAQDPDQPAVAIDVHVYFNGPPGDPMGTGIPINANQTRDDLCMMLGGTCEHGYTLELPLGVRDGAAHNVWVYGIDLEGVNNPLLGGPVETSCPPPPIVSGVRRWITSPEILAAWQFSTFVDMLRVDDVSLAAVPEDAQWPAAPMLLTSDAGDGTLWIIDGPFRREVPEDVVVAWRFAVDTAVVTPEAQLDAMPLGPDLRVRPFLLQGTTPAVYLLDEPPCEPMGCEEDVGTTGAVGESGNADLTDGAGTDDPTVDPSGGNPSEGDAGTSGGAGTSGPGIDPSGGDGPTPSEGCGCMTSRASSAWWLLALASARRRRGAPLRSARAVSSPDAPPRTRP
jgi:hypothetical protein